VKADFARPEVSQDAEICPIRDVLDRVGDQWSLLVLGALAHSTLRFNALKREVEGISQQMLARTLKRLEEDGLVSRKLFPVIPPRVDYALTPLGRSFLKPFAALIEWANSHHAAIRAARKSYRQQHKA
jgi:DNA-binding HxlR family transcriptional regulator